MGTVFIRQMSMPRTVYGATVVDADGNYNVYINENLCDSKKQDTVDHELRHIESGHFHDTDSVESNERAAAVAVALADTRSRIWLDW